MNKIKYLVIFAFLLVIAVEASDGAECKFVNLTLVPLAEISKKDLEKDVSLGMKDLELQQIQENLIKREKELVEALECIREQHAELERFYTIEDTPLLNERGVVVVKTNREEQLAQLCDEKIRQISVLYGERVMRLKKFILDFLKERDEDEERKYREYEMEFEAIKKECSVEFPVYDGGTSRKCLVIEQPIEVERRVIIEVPVEIIKDSEATLEEMNTLRKKLQQINEDDLEPILEDADGNFSLALKTRREQQVFDYFKEEVAQLARQKLEVEGILKLNLNLLEKQKELSFLEEEKEKGKGQEELSWFSKKNLIEVMTQTEEEELTENEQLLLKKLGVLEETVKKYCVEINILQKQIEDYDKDENRYLVEIPIEIEVPVEVEKIVYVDREVEVPDYGIYDIKENNSVKQKDTKTEKIIFVDQEIQVNQEEQKIKTDGILFDKEEKTAKMKNISDELFWQKNKANIVGAASAFSALVYGINCLESGVKPSQLLGQVIRDFSRSLKFGLNFLRRRLNDTSISRNPLNHLGKLTIALGSVFGVLKIIEDKNNSIRKNTQTETEI